MLVTRWQAPSLPSMDQIKMIFAAEGMQPTEESYPPSSLVREHKHPFDEVRMIVSGQIIFNVAGNRLLLRAGDRIVVPAFNNRGL